MSNNGRIDMCRIVCCLVLAACLGTADVSMAGIYLTSSLSPGGAITVGAGDVGKTYNVDVYASIVTPGEIISAYDLDVLYNHSILNPASVTFGPWLGSVTSYEVLQGSNFTVDGVANLKAASLITSDADIYTLQQPAGGNILLATLTFTAVNSGVSSLSFDWGLTSRGLRDVKGMNNVAFTMVPEPSTLLCALIAGPIAAAAVWYRRRRSGAPLSS